MIIPCTIFNQHLYVEQTDKRTVDNPEGGQVGQLPHNLLYNPGLYRKILIKGTTKLNQSLGEFDKYGAMTSLDCVNRLWVQKQQQKRKNRRLSLSGSTLDAISTHQMNKGIINSTTQEKEGRKPIKSTHSYTTKPNYNRNLLYKSGNEGTQQLDYLQQKSRGVTTRQGSTFKKPIRKSGWARRKNQSMGEMQRESYELQGFTNQSLKQRITDPFSSSSVNYGGTKQRRHSSSASSDCRHSQIKYTLSRANQTLMKHQLKNKQDHYVQREMQRRLNDYKKNLNQQIRVQNWITAQKAERQLSKQRSSSQGRERATSNKVRLEYWNMRRPLIEQSLHQDRFIKRQTKSLESRLNQQELKEIEKNQAIDRQRAKFQRSVAISNGKEALLKLRKIKRNRQKIQAKRQIQIGRVLAEASFVLQKAKKVLFQPTPEMIDNAFKPEIPMKFENEPPTNKLSQGKRSLNTYKGR